MTDALRFTIDDFMDRTDGIQRLEKTFDNFVIETALYREAMHGTLREHGDRLKAIETCVVLGNGEPPLKEQVHTCAAEIEAIQADNARREAQKKEGVVARWQFWGAVSVAIIGAVVAIIVSLTEGGSDLLQADEVRQILQIVREEEEAQAMAPASLPWSSLP